MQYKVSIGVTTDKGRHRSRNEDNFLFRGKYLSSGKENKSVKGNCKPPVLFALCDGMGGSDCGKEAAAAAIHFLHQNSGYLSGVSCDLMEQELDCLIKKASAEVYSLGYQGKKPGCTLALVYMHQNKIYLANVGDSRIYLITDNDMKQLSIDHNLFHAMEALADKSRNPIQNKNILTQYLGMSPQEIIIEPHYEILDYNNMTLLLCSDGLYHSLDPETMREIIRKYSGKSLKKATKILIKKAVMHGAKDNLTAMLIDIKTDKRRGKNDGI